MCLLRITYGRCFDPRIDSFSYRQGTRSIHNRKVPQTPPSAEIARRHSAIMLVEECGESTLRKCEAIEQALRTGLFEAADAVTVRTDDVTLGYYGI